MLDIVFYCYYLNVALEFYVILSIDWFQLVKIAIYSPISPCPIPSPPTGWTNWKLLRSMLASEINDKFSPVNISTYILYIFLILVSNKVLLNYLYLYPSFLIFYQAFVSLLFKYPYPPVPGLETVEVFWLFGWLPVDVLLPGDCSLLEELLRLFIMSQNSLKK